MLLVIDIGNTNIAFGVFQGKKLAYHFRTESVRSRTIDEYRVLVYQMLRLRSVDPSAIGSAIIASVVPVLTDTLIEVVRHSFARDPIVVGPGVKTGIPILYENPREVGADRIVNAVAAFEMVGAGSIVVDFGTATTFDCITPKGEYLGGCIAPGIKISAEALFRNASKLHRVEISAPTKVVGRNSSHSMQSGIVYGYAGLVTGLVKRIKAELDYPTTVLATGGLAPMIAIEAEGIDEIVENLTLDGLRLIYERNLSKPGA